ncbi:HNH endonuclease [compost metagenome]
MANPCPHGHIVERSIADGKCVECNRIICARTAQAKRDADPEKQAAIAEARRVAAERKDDIAVKSEAWNKLRESRQAAIASGALTYHGRECPYGHGTERYTSGGNCIACSAEFSSSDHKKEYDKQYQEDNAERIQARRKDYQARTSAQRTVAATAWARSNPEKRKAIAKAYKHRRRTIEKQGSSTADLMAWEAAVKKNCYWCGKKKLKKYHVDHYQPLSKGGAHTVSNLVIACPRCNLTKSAKDPYLFAQSIGRLF